MSNYREIVTKAVIGKGKKHFTTTSSITPEVKPTTILGCWVINHNFSGHKENNNILIEGSYDINIWYSCENDTKTEVIRKTENYRELVISPQLNNETNLPDNEEIIIRSLNSPKCVKTEIVDGTINYIIEKDLGIEIVGDTKVKIETTQDDDSWEELEEKVEEEKIIEDITEKIDEEVKEEFLN